MNRSSCDYLSRKFHYLFVCILNVTSVFVDLRLFLVLSVRSDSLILQIISLQAHVFCSLPLLVHLYKTLNLLPISWKWFQTSTFLESHFKLSVINVKNLFCIRSLIHEICWNIIALFNISHKDCSTFVFFFISLICNMLSGPFLSFSYITITSLVFIVWGYFGLDIFSGSRLFVSFVLLLF